MPKWEYLFGTMSNLRWSSSEHYGDMLNRLGAEGWELVSVSVLPGDGEECLWFKRPLVSTEVPGLPAGCTS